MWEAVRHDRRIWIFIAARGSPPHGILHMRSLPPCSITSPLTLPLMACEIREWEKIEVRLQSKWKMVKHSTSYHEHHFTCSRTDTILGLQGGQSQIHCLYIHRKFSELKILSGKGKNIGISIQFLDSNCSAKTDEVKARTQERGDRIRLPKGHNRKCHCGGTKQGDWYRTC